MFVEEFNTGTDTLTIKHLKYVTATHSASYSQWNGRKQEK